MRVMAGTNMNTILSNDNGRCIELLHRAEDACIWIVRSSKKILWFRMNATTVWFQDKQQALAFAQTQAEEHRTNRKNINV